MASMTYSKLINKHKNVAYPYLSYVRKKKRFWCPLNMNS